MEPCPVSSCKHEQLVNPRIQNEGDELDGLYQECAECHSTTFIPLAEITATIKSAIESRGKNE